MIIVSLQGGLGNQMFQYAFGRALALETKSDLKLDITKLSTGSPPRNYKLGHFNIIEQIATLNEIKMLTPSENILTRISPRIKKLISQLNKSYLNEAYSNGNIPRNFSDLYVDGYWQSEDFFITHEKVIRQDFTFKTPQKKITEKNSVAVHVRRTDYVNRGTRKPIIGCSIDYYERAAKLLISKTGKPIFFVFSDDLAWCKNNIFFPGFETKYVSGSELDNLSCMSSCSHNIVANSSFGWWGAWLNPNPKKIVIAPNPWLENSADPVPDSWIKIPKV